MVMISALLIYIAYMAWNKHSMLYSYHVLDLVDWSIRGCGAVYHNTKKKVLKLGLILWHHMKRLYLHWNSYNITILLYSNGSHSCSICHSVYNTVMFNAPNWIEVLFLLGPALLKADTVMLQTEPGGILLRVQDVAVTFITMLSLPLMW